MVSEKEKFGEFVRRERKAKEIGLREMAKMIGVSPTYLSKIERDEFPPPAEDKVKAIAKIIECDPDDLLARAGRVSTDISDIIKRHPVELAALLRTTKGLTADGIARLARQGGLRSVVAESILVKHQLLILNRGRKHAPNLRTADRTTICRRSGRRRDGEVEIGR